MSTLASRALVLAQSQIGQANTSGPRLSPIVVWSLAPWIRHDPEPGAAWGAGFASSCFLHAEAEMAPRVARWQQVGAPDGPTLLRRCEAHGFFSRPLCEVEEVQPGELVFFSDGEGASCVQHVGLVEQLSNRQLRTIEGDAGDAVRRRIYHLSFPRLHRLVRCPW